MQLIIPIALVLFTNSFLNVGPWWHVSGVFNIMDVGNAFLWCCLIGLFVFSNRKERLINVISLLIIFHIFFVFVQIMLAHVYYGQGWFDGLVAIRHHFYYVSFFVFLLLFSNQEKVMQLLDLLVIIAVVSLVLGLVNYFGPNILSHKLAVDERLRSGVKRAFVPAMDVLSFALIWLFVRWSTRSNLSKFQRGSAFFLLIGHIFRQSRMRLVGVTVILLGTLAMRRKWKPLFALVIACILLFGAMELRKEENIITTLVGSAFSDVIYRKGTMSPRIEMIKIDVEEFLRHPWIGGGTCALRRPSGDAPTRLQVKTAELSYYHDLGYTHWLKFFGIAGIVWLTVLLGAQFAMGVHVLKHGNENDRKLTLFALSYLMYVVTTQFTLDHLMIPSRILLNMLCAAIIVVSYKNTVESIDTIEDEVFKNAP